MINRFTLAQLRLLPVFGRWLLLNLIGQLQAIICCVGDLCLGIQCVSPMAFVFAGKGVLELIEGKLFQPTLLAGAPEVGWLGIYPYAATLAPQAALIAAALIALWVMARQRASNRVPLETAAS